MSRIGTGETLDEFQERVARGWRPGSQVESNTSGATTDTGNQRGPKPVTRALRDIEATADFYDPGTYHAGLTFGPDLTTEPDNLGSQFIPLSPIKKNPKIFAVGVLPPQAPITGRILDRSASIRDILEAPTGVPGANFDVTTTEGGTQEEGPRGDPAAYEKLPDQFWIEFVSMCEDLGINPYAVAAVFYNESQFDPHAQYPGGIAKGLGQFVRSTALGTVEMPPEVFDNFENLSAREQLPYFENLLSKMHGLSSSPDDTVEERHETATSLYSRWVGGYPANNAWFGNANYISAEAQANLRSRLLEEQARITQQLESGSLPESERRRLIDKRERNAATLQSGFTNPGTQQQAYELNKQLDYNGDGIISRIDLGYKLQNLPPFGVQAKIEEALNSGLRSPRVPRQEDGGLKEGEEEPTPEWENQGSESAEEAARRRERIANTGYNATTIGDQFTAAQWCEIKQTQAAVEAMRGLPPLRMLLNPSSFAVKSEKIASDGNWSRRGPIIEFWGDNQDKISASGQVAGFYSMDQANATGPGLTRNARQFSESYRNFLGLYQLYRNNGGVYLAPCGAGEKERNLSLLGSIYLYYDNILYFGSFDSFTVSEEDDKPFTLNYSWEFTIRAAFLLDRPSDPGISYGIQAQKFMAPEQATLPYREAPKPVVEGTISDINDIPGIDEFASSGATQEEIDAERAALQQEADEAALLQARQDLVLSVTRTPENPSLGTQDRLVIFQRQQAKFNAGSISWEELQAWQQRLELTNEEINQ